MTADLTTVAVSTIILALSICLSTKLLGKRSRGEDHSLCPESKRARLDEATSSSNQVAQELTPVQEASLSADRIVCLINMSRNLTSLSQSSSSEYLQEYLA